MFYYVCKAKYLWQNEEVSTETFQVCAETKEAALEKANCHCDTTVNQIVCSFKSAAEKLSNGIIVSPVTEYEANEQRFALMHDYPETKFEIKEVK